MPAPITCWQLIGDTGRARSLLLVGHNPGFHDLAVALIASGDVTARERLNENLPTAGLVVIDLALDDWAPLHRAPAGWSASSRRG